MANESIKELAPAGRLDWRLVRPRRDGAGPADALVRHVDRLVVKAASEGISPAESQLLTELESRYEEQTVPQCEAVGAPRVEDDPDWESRIIDEFDISEVGMELDDYLELRRHDPDCDRCPYASPYSIYPMDPCEFSAGALGAVTGLPEIAHAARAPMSAEDMAALAVSLDERVTSGLPLAEVAGLDALDYLEKAIYFLRFWAGLGFGLLPDDSEALDVAGIDDGDAERGGGRPVIH